MDHSKQRQKIALSGWAMGDTDEANPIDPVLQLAQQCIAAATIKEFAAVISKANLTLNDQEWRRFMAEGRRLKNESQQMENIR
ncbi:MAG TPA: hypothetical protein VEC93_00265 [Anaerolineae bacterium]|nr:hypothetical protein [Anaerolineae bacterium]